MSVISNLNIGRLDQKGFSLVEVLVALVILAIGLLGLAALQSKSLGGGQSAYLRSQATLYAYDIIERMRANRPEALLDNSPYEVDFGDVPAGSLPSLVKNDLDDWLAGVNNLPNGQGAVDIASLGVGRVLATIEVRWEEKGSTESVQVETML